MSCKDYLAENCLFPSEYVLRQLRMLSSLFYMPWNKCLIISPSGRKDNYYLADCHPVENLSGPCYLFIHEMFIKTYLLCTGPYNRSYLLQKMSKKASCPEAEVRVVCERNNGRRERKRREFLFYVPGMGQEGLLRESGLQTESGISVGCANGRDLNSWRTLESCWVQVDSLCALYPWTV